MFPSILRLMASIQESISFSLSATMKNTLRDVPTENINLFFLSFSSLTKESFSSSIIPVASKSYKQNDNKCDCHKKYIALWETYISCFKII